MDPSECYSGRSYEAEDSDAKDHGEIPDLQKLCLLEILQNFDRFCAAFKMRTSEVPKQHWEFLARRYSEKIFEKLKETEELKREHLDLLISPHMEKLDIVGIDRKLIPDLVQSLKKNGANIQSFKGQCRDVDEDMRTSLMSALPKVEEIDYLHYECFSGVETTLKEKILRFGKRSAPKLFAQIPQIYKSIGQNCRLLKSLTFEYCDDCPRNQNKGMAFILKNCPFLEILQYPDTIGALYELHKSYLPLLKNYKKRFPKTNVKYILKNLTSENRARRYYPLLDALEICVATCPCVSRLYLDCLNRDEELEVISRFTQLQEIKFETQGELSSSCLGKFFELSGKKLTSLEMVFQCELPIETLIGSCPKLQSLILSHFVLHKPKGTGEQPCEASLPDLKTVEFLFSNFAFPEVGTALKTILSAAKNADKLSLKGSSGLTNKFLRSLDLSSIRFLDASCSDITVDSLMELVLHGSLKTLQIEFCENLSYEDYFSLTRWVTHNNKNVHIKYHPVLSSSWRNSVLCYIAYTR